MVAEVLGLGFRVCGSLGSVRATGCTELVGGPGGLGGGGWSPRRVKWAVMVGRGLLVEAIAFLVKVESDMMAVKLGVVVLEVEGVNMKLDVAEVKQVVVRLVEEKSAHIGFTFSGGRVTVSSRWKRGESSGP